MLVQKMWVRWETEVVPADFLFPPSHLECHTVGILLGGHPQQKTFFWEFSVCRRVNPQ